MSEKYITNLSYCLNCVLPPGDWSKIEEFFVLNKEKTTELSTVETEFFSKRKNILEIREFYNDDKKVNYLIENEILVKKYKYNNSENKFIEKFVKLNEDFDFSKIRKNAVKQLELINFLKGKDFVSVKDLRENNFSKSVVDSLILVNALIQTEDKVYKNSVEDTSSYKKLNLNKEQQDVLNNVLSSKNDKFLIHGITGSGKTEIYLQLVENMLEQGKSSIILVPEISLTPQTIERFSGRFGNDIAIIHSRLTTIEKLNQWKQIQDKDIKIVVGARSAIFSPVIGSFSFTIAIIFNCLSFSWIIITYLITYLPFKYCVILLLNMIYHFYIVYYNTSYLIRQDLFFNIYEPLLLSFYYKANYVIIIGIYPFKINISLWVKNIKK